MAKCVVIKANGEPCKVDAMPGSVKCWNHDKSMSEARHRRASKGGRTAGRGRPMLEVHDIAAQLQSLVDQVLSGELDRGDAAVCGQLLNYKTRALDVARMWRETEELAKEVEELREVVEADKERRQYGA